MKNDTCLVFGSKLSEGLINFLKIKVVANIIGCSPLSSGKSNYDLLENFEILCKQKNPKYLVIDLYTCARYLYKSGESVLTYEGPDSEINKIYNPVTTYTQSMRNNFNNFIDMCKKYFPGENIFVINANYNKVYTIGSQLRYHQHNYNDNVMFISKRIDVFIKNTHANKIDIPKFYFNSKVKHFNVNYEIFEDEMYDDISRSIDEYINENKKRFEEPCFELCVDRYIKLQGRTMLYLLFETFLDKTKITDSIVLNSSQKFVEKYKNEFCVLKELENASENKSDKILKLIEETRFPEVFKNVVTSYIELDSILGDSILESLKSDIEVHKDFFRSGSIVPRLLTELRNYYKEKGMNPKLVNKKNAGYMLALKNGNSKEYASQFLGEEAVATPVLADVYGSCIANCSVSSNIILNDNISRNKYLFHVPFYASNERSVRYPKELFEGMDKSNIRSICTQLQFDGKVKDYIMESDAEWMIIDLYSFFASNTYRYREIVFTDTAVEFVKRIECYKTKIWKQYKLYGGKEKLFERIKKVCGWLKEKYQDRIILVDFNISDLQIGDDDIIYSVRDETQMQNVKFMLDEFKKFIYDELNCYNITVGDAFLADDAGYLSRVYVHYEFGFYDSVNALINKIVKERPEQKIFDSYEAKIKLDRMIRLIPKNNRYLLKMIFTKELDEVILQIPCEIIKKYRAEIENWYAKGITGKNEILSDIDFSGKEDLYKYVANARSIYPIKLCSLAKEYEDYSEWIVEDDTKII